MFVLPDPSYPTGVETLTTGADRSWPDASTYNGELAVKIRNRHSAAITLTVRTLSKPEADSTLVVAADETANLAVRKINSVTLSGPLDVFTVKVRNLEMLS